MHTTETRVIRISIDDDGILEDDAYLEAYAELLTRYDPADFEYIEMRGDGSTYTYEWTVTL